MSSLSKICKSIPIQFRNQIEPTIIVLINEEKSKTGEKENSNFSPLVYFSHIIRKNHKIESLPNFPLNTFRVFVEKKEERKEIFFAPLLICDLNFMNRKLLFGFSSISFYFVGLVKKPRFSSLKNSKKSIIKYLHLLIFLSVPLEIGKKLRRITTW